MTQGCPAALPWKVASPRTRLTMSMVSSDPYITEDTEMYTAVYGPGSLTTRGESGSVQEKARSHILSSLFYYCSFQGRDEGR